MTPASERSKLTFKTRLAVLLGGLLLRVLGATWRIRDVGRDELIARTANDSRVIYSLWHGQMLPILYQHKYPTCVMVSEHRDGEIIARILRMFGFSAFRGSSSRGGARALLEGVRLLKTTDVAITPDGPRGPRHSFAPGALLLSLRANVSVCPVVAYADRKWTMGSWDALEIPKPFARVTVLYGKRVSVNAASARDAADQSEQFRQIMLSESERLKSEYGCA